MKVIFKKSITGHEILIADKRIGAIDEVAAGDLVSCNHWPYKPVEILRLVENGLTWRWGGEHTLGWFECTDEFLRREYHKWFYHDVDTGEIATANYTKINAATYGL